MKNFKLFLFTLILAAVALVTVPMLALAADVAPADFLSQLLDAVRALGGLSWAGKVASICLLIVASMKVSFLKPLWDWVGGAQVFVAPALALIGGLLSMPSITLQGSLAYIFAGAGALALHELLDGVKAIPGLGAVYVAIINFVSGILGGAQAEAAAK